MGRMHSDAQFAGSSSVPAHVEMMGFLGIGITQWLVQQKDKDAQRSCAIAGDIAGALSK